MTTEFAGIIIAVVALIQAVGVAIINGIMTRREKDNESYRAKREKMERVQEEEREQQDRVRKELEAAVLSLSFASAEGTEVLLRQAHGDKVNGNVNAALSSIHSAKDRCNELVNKTAVGL